MPVGNMSDLMTHHGGEFRLVIDGAQEASSHVDEATRESECVYRGVVYYVELPGEIWPFGVCGNPLADARYVVVDLGVIVDADRLGDLLGGLLTHLDLLGFRDERQLALSRDRIP